MPTKKLERLSLQPVKPDIAKVPLLKLPTNIFETIAGFLDSYSLLELANAHRDLRNSVRNSKKRWSEVRAYSDCYYIDYNFCNLLDANILLSNATIGSFNEVLEMPGARGLVDLPKELLDEIAKPLFSSEILRVAAIGGRLEKFGARMPIKYLGHDPGDFDIRGRSLEPNWVLRNGQSLEDGALDDRLVETVAFWGTSLPPKYQKLWKLQPRFRCKNFIYQAAITSGISDDPDSCLDKDTLQKVLRPENVWSSDVMSFLSGPNFPKGAVTVGCISARQLPAIIKLTTPRLAFNPRATGKPVLDVICHFVDEWMEGKREIDTIWFHPTWADTDVHKPRLCAKHIGDDQLMEWWVGQLRTNLVNFNQIVIPGLDKYGLTLSEDTMSIQAELQRKDGKRLQIRARTEDIVLQAPGDKTSFLIWYGNHGEPHENQEAPKF